MKTQNLAYINHNSCISVIDTDTKKVIDKIKAGFGAGLFGAAVTSDGKYVYVLNRRFNNVQVIDTNTNQVTYIIDVGNNPYDITISLDGMYAYVTNSESNNVSVINTNTKNVIDTIEVGYNPYSIAITPDGKYAYITHNCANKVSVIDTNIKKVIDIIEFEDGKILSGIAINPEEQFAYVAAMKEDNKGDIGLILKLDIINNKFTEIISLKHSIPNKIAFIPNGKCAYVTVNTNEVFELCNIAGHLSINSIKLDIEGQTFDVAITPDGMFAYATVENGKIKVIDTHIFIVVDTIECENFELKYITITPKGFFAYVTSYSDVVVIEINSNRIIDNIEFTSDPISSAITSDGSYIYTANNTAEIGVIDTTKKMVTDVTEKILYFPGRIAITPDDKFIYVVSQITRMVVVVDTSTNKIIKTINLNDAAYGIAITPDGKFVYVTMHPRNIAVIDTTTNMVTDIISCEFLPMDIAIMPDGKFAYFANYDANNVTVIDISRKKAITTINVGVNPTAIAITSDGKFIYVINQRSNNLSVIDTSKNEVIATVKVGNEPIDIAITPDGKFIYVTNGISKNISVIETNNFTVVETIDTKETPYGIVISSQNIPDALYLLKLCIYILCLILKNFRINKI